MSVANWVRKRLGLPCWECGGKGYVIDSEVADFIDRYGLATYQVANTLLSCEIDYGSLGSLKTGAWSDLGMSDEQVSDFFVIAHSHEVISCNSCDVQPNHPTPLSAAKAVLNAWIAKRDRRAEHQCSQGAAE